MFEETEWEYNETEKSLAKTLFQEYPKMKKKQKTKDKTMDQDKIKQSESETKPKVTLSLSSKDHVKDKTTRKQKHGKRVSTDCIMKGQSDRKLSKQVALLKKPKKTLKTPLNKFNNGTVRNKSQKLKDISKGDIDAKDGTNESVNLVSEKCANDKSKKRQKLQNVPKGEVNAKDRINESVNLVPEKSNNGKRKKNKGDGVKVSKKSKQRNKYKSMIGEEKDVGRDVKVNKPVLDIPRKLKLAGMKPSNIDKAEVAAVIHEMSGEKTVVRHKRKRKQKGPVKGEKGDGAGMEMPQVKKRKRKLTQESVIDETCDEKTGKGDDPLNIKSDLDAFIHQGKKTKGKRKRIREASSEQENTLTMKKKKKKSFSIQTDLNQSEAGQTCDKLNNLGICKHRLSVSKLKSLLSQEKVEGVPDKDIEPVKEEKEKVSPNKVTMKQMKVESLKEKLEGRLKSSRFRFLNEQLYTRTGEEALQMFTDDMDAFHCYHQGFQSQVAKWPNNPVDQVIEYLKARPASLVVADFGCGEAKVAQSVKNQVHSFDLVKVNEYITVCDIQKVPLDQESVDVAVFCLSLMGTNFTDYLCEASRVLQTGGTLLIAEVTSRFDRPTRFARKVEKLGFTLENQDQTNKMFIWFEFKKSGNIPAEDRIPKLDLAPCYYKRR